MAATEKTIKSAKTVSQKTASRRTRKIMQPPRQGTISRSLIKKVIKEVIANRPVTNEI